jgi:hypothetical protein
MFPSKRANFQLCLFFALSLLCVATASSHFKLNLNVRILHVEHLSDGLNGWETCSLCGCRAVKTFY